MTEKSDTAGFLLVYPEGTGLPRGWNAGTCCGNTGSVDDVGFAAAMIDSLSQVLCVDAKRIYAAGMSNAGMFSHRSACELGHRFAAIAAVAGTIAYSPCEPSRPVPVIHLHGTADRVVPYEGGGFARLPPVAETIAGWVRRNGCTEPAREVFGNGDSRCESHGGCAAGSEVVLCTVDGGGHSWPGGADLPLNGHTTVDLIANDAIWGFFIAHPLP